MASIFDIIDFDGIGMGTIQSVDEMTVVPLVGETRGNITSPSNLKFERTTGYGSMQFSNEGDKPAIVPSNMMVRGTGGQDHAMSGSGVILAKATQSFDTACCIEETQGGLLSSIGNDEDILPIGLRKTLLNYGKRTEHGYSKLWGEIKSWLRGMNLGHRNSAHLRYFYDDKSVGNELERFAAEFEPLENQIGAIIMFNGVPVGLEIMPSTEHWDTYWKYLLRGCYGAELVRMKMLNKLEPSTLILPDLPELSKDPESEELDKFKHVLDDFINHLRDEVLPILEQIQISGNRQVGKTSNLETRMVSTPSGGGDIILQDSKPVYISMIL